MSVYFELILILVYVILVVVDRNDEKYGKFFQCFYITVIIIIKTIKKDE